jgi:hypothetical protein
MEIGWKSHSRGFESLSPYMFELILLSIFVTNTVPTETVEKHLNKEAIAVVGLVIGVGIVI